MLTVHDSAPSHGLSQSDKKHKQLKRICRRQTCYYLTRDTTSMPSNERHADAEISTRDPQQRCDARFEVKKFFLGREGKDQLPESTPILHRGKGLVWLNFPNQPSTYAIFLSNVFQFYQWCPTNELEGIEFT